MQEKSTLQRVLSSVIPELRQQVQEVTTINSTEKDGIKRWPSYNAEVGGYEAMFQSVLPEGKLHKLLSSVKSPVVIDLMSPSSALYSLFKELSQESKLGIAVTLE